jgi:hypothetical protein
MILSIPAHHFLKISISRGVKRLFSRRSGRLRNVRIRDVSVRQRSIAR